MISLARLRRAERAAESLDDGGDWRIAGLSGRTRTTMSGNSPLRPPASIPRLAFCNRRPNRPLGTKATRGHRGGTAKGKSYGMKLESRLKRLENATSRFADPSLMDPKQRFAGNTREQVVENARDRLAMLLRRDGRHDKADGIAQMSVDQFLDFTRWVNAWKKQRGRQ